MQPFNDLSHKENVPVGEQRDYQVEFWPIGNRFEAGHRIRLTLAGTPLTFSPSVPAINSIVVGGANGAELQFPYLPGSDLCKALGSRPVPRRREAQLRREASAGDQAGDREAAGRRHARAARQTGARAASEQR